jgi:hypothetical protein
MEKSKTFNIRSPEMMNCEIKKRTLWTSALGHGHGHIEEGASADKLCLGILGIATRNVEMHSHMNAELSNVEMTK